MKKLFTVALILMMLVCGFAHAEDTSISYIQDKGTFILGLDDSFPPMGFRDENGKRVCFGGKIDRVDIYENEGKIYFRVIDYKSSKHTFSIDDIRSGLDIQLILYLFALSSVQMLLEQLVIADFLSLVQAAVLIEESDW